MAAGMQRDTYYSRQISTLSTSGWSQNLGTGSSGTKPARRRLNLRRTLMKARAAVAEHWQRTWVLLLWGAAMAALFTWKFTQYRRLPAFVVMGNCLPVAKGAAETLKLNMALILLPVYRNTLTWLRSTRARHFVPFDNNISFHKRVAAAIFVGIVPHAGTHLTCDFPKFISASPDLYQLVARDFRARKTAYGSLLARVEGVTGITMVLHMSISFTLATDRFRKNGARLPRPLNRLTGFNAFWYSHHLLGVVYLLLIVHGYFLFLVHIWYQRTAPFLYNISTRG